MEKEERCAVCLMVSWDCSSRAFEGADECCAQDYEEEDACMLGTCFHGFHEECLSVRLVSLLCRCSC